MGAGLIQVVDRRDDSDRHSSIETLERDSELPVVEGAGAGTLHREAKDITKQRLDKCNGCRG